MDDARKTDSWFSLNQAAGELDESRVAVLQRIARGELAHDIVAGRTVVSRESVEKVKTSKENGFTELE